MSIWHFKAPARYLPSDSPAVSWGEWTVFIEVSEDQLAVRQINRFKNGNVLCYDGEHRRDEFGYLSGLRFSKKPKWRKFYPNAETMTCEEFDRLWRESLSSTNCVNRNAIANRNHLRDTHGIDTVKRQSRQLQAD
jgi:hypothetical protein